MTLLKLAKELHTRKATKSTPEMRELALAWLENEVSHSQCIKALYGRKAIRGNVLYKFALCFRDLYEAGKIKIVK